MNLRIIVVAAVLALTAFFPTATLAVETKVLRDETFSDFNQGESTGTELLALGRLRVAPQAVRRDKGEEGVAWNVAIDPYDGHMFYVTGHNGKVFHITPDGKSEQWADLAEVEAISIAIDPKGGVLVGASPGGKIYRIVKQNKPELFFETREQYVWNMIFDRNGVMYAGTGPQGKIFRIRGHNNGEVLYDSDATNVMGLNFDREGNLIAATQGKAMVLRISSTKKAYVMYASQEDECRSLAVDNRGNIYAAINSARVSSLLDKTPDKSDDKPTGLMATATPSPTPRPPGIVLEVRPGSTPSAGSASSFNLGGSSFVVQIQPNGFVTNFWRSPEGPIHSMLADLDTNSVFVSAGNKGKVYRLESDTNYSVIADVEETAVLSFAQHNKQIFFSTANKASVYEFVTTQTQEGLFDSRAMNAGSTVQWGNLFYEAEETSGSEIGFETRTGNTSEPDDRNWSPWIAATRVAPRLMKIQSPVAQYLQYRLRMKPAPDGASPELDNVQLFHVQRNVAPIIRNIRVDKIGGEQTPPDVAILIGGGRPSPTPSPTPSAASSGSTPGSSPGNPLESALAAAARAASTPSSSSGRTGSSSPQFTSAVGSVQNSHRYGVSWDVADPNGDRLQFRLLFKGEDEQEWKEIEKDLTTPRYTFNTEAIPDGKYRLRVDATDELANPETIASTTSLVSRVIFVDNSHPEITGLKGEKAGKNEYVITATTQDEISILSAAEYNVDAAKEWRALLPEDGIFDFNTETFRFTIKPEKESPEHTLSLRVYDREGNSRVEKVLLK